MYFGIISPFELVANPWNINGVDRVNFEKLKVSMTKLGSFKPVVVRELEDGTLQILGGYHRTEAAKELAWPKIDYVNLGIIDDKTAKEIALVDNTRYGTDDEERLQALLDEIGDLTVLDSIMPEVALELPEIEAGDTDLEELPEKEPEPDTHKVLKFKLEIDKAEEIEAVLCRVADKHDYKYKDGHTNMAEALYHILVIERK